MGVVRKKKLCYNKKPEEAGVTASNKRHIGGRNMKKIMKLTALLLSVAMVLSLAACGKTGGDVSTDEKVKLVIGIPAASSVVSFGDDNAFTQWLEENSGYDIEVMEFPSDYTTQLSAMITGGEKLPDIMMAFTKINKQMQTFYGEQGYFLNLKPYFEDEALTADYRARIAELHGEDYFDFLMASITVADGQIYGYPSVNINEDDLPRFQMYINGTWLDNLGLEMPTNYEELVAVLEAFKTQDPNGNGQPDEIPAIGKTNNVYWDTAAWVINNWQYMNDGFFFNLDDNGKLVLPYDTAEYREGLKALHDLVGDGLLSTLSWTITSNAEYKSVLNPADGVAKVGVFGMHLINAFGAEAPVMDEYEPLPPFNYAPLNGTMAGTGVFVAGDTKYPDECFRLLQLISSEAGSMAMHYGKEGVDWEWGSDYGTDNVAVKVLNDFAAQNLSTWNKDSATLFRFGSKTKYHTAIVNAPESMTWGERRDTKTADYAEKYYAMAEANNPDKIIEITLVYNDEENDRIGNIQTDVMTYVKEMRAKFASGELDPYSDADWTKYVDTLHNMGTATWLENSQTAYDRFMGN